MTVTDTIAYSELPIFANNREQIGQGMISFNPRGEHQNDIRDSLPDSFYGGSVIAIAGYGYPQFLLAEGADSVVAVDIAASEIAWSKLWKSAAQVLNYEQMCFVFRGNDDIFQPTIYNEIIGKIINNFEGNPEERFTALNLLDRYRGHIRIEDSPNTSLKPVDSYTDERSSIGTEGRFERISQAARNGKWTIKHMDIGEYLQEAIQTQELASIDFVFLSNIRHWLQYAIERVSHQSSELTESIDEVKTRMNDQLSRLLDAVIAPKGVVYEWNWILNEDSLSLKGAEGWSFNRNDQAEAVNGIFTYTKDA